MSVSRVRENRMHGLTGGGWKRGNLRHRASPLPSQSEPDNSTIHSPARPVVRHRPGQRSAVRAGHRQRVDDTPGHGDGHRLRRCHPGGAEPGVTRTPRPPAPRVWRPLSVRCWVVVSSTGDASSDTGGPAAVGATVEVEDNFPVPHRPPRSARPLPRSPVKCGFIWRPFRGAFWRDRVRP